jgi:hypothetical protein
MHHIGFITFSDPARAVIEWRLIRYSCVRIAKKAPTLILGGLVFAIECIPDRSLLILLGSVRTLLATYALAPLHILRALFREGSRTHRREGSRTHRRGYQTLASEHAY